MYTRYTKTLNLGLEVNTQDNTHERGSFYSRTTLSHAADTEAADLAALDIHNSMFIV